MISKSAQNGLKNGKGCPSTTPPRSIEIKRDLNAFKGVLARDAGGNFAGFRGIHPDLH